jgi:UDP:flavonoid glycosyltransferase YjiC (YdhE family)
MARVLFAWELGGDYGHLTRLNVLARELRRRGHEPVFAIRDLTFVEAVFRGEPCAVFQAPVWMGSVTGLPAPIGFAETLMRVGFFHPDALTGVCRAWRTLADAVQPGLLVFDYAPTGMLATRGLRVPRVVVGESFCVPPRTEPMPVYRWWRPEPEARILDAERRVLTNANAVLARFSEPPMQRLADLLEAEAEVITASKEFDQYPDRVDGQYWGSVASLGAGTPPRWPADGRKRVFAYLKPRHRDFDPLLAALRAIDASVVVHAPGVSPHAVRTHTTANVTFSVDLVRMADVCRECDLGICHSGANTVHALVTAGKPVLLLPQHLEQMMTAKRVLELGAGLVVDYEEPAPDYRELLRLLLEEPSFTQAARAVAARHVGDDPAARVARIVDRFEALLGGTVEKGPDAGSPPSTTVRTAGARP